MFSFIGLESLKQRGRSVLYTDLTYVYQEALDALYDSPEASKQYIVAVLNNIKFTNKLRATISKYIGPVFKNVYLGRGDEPNLGSYTAQDLSFVKKKYKNKTTVGILLEDIKKYYDDKNFHLNENYEDAGWRVYASLTVSLFRIRNPDNSFLFTAEELAAMTLHELGHVDNYIRTSLRIRNTIQDASDIVDYINIAPDVTVVREIISQLKKSEFLDKSWKQVLKVVDQYFSTSNSLDDPSYYEALGSLTTVFAAESALKVNPYISNLANFTNDRKTTRLQAVDKERSADEFAGRHGSYAALVSGFGKMHSLDEDKSYLLYKTFMDHNPASFYSLLTLFEATFKISLEDISEKYDPLVKRMALIVETAKHAFKEDDLSPEVMEDIKKQITESEAYITKFNNSPHRKIRRELYLWKENVSKFGRIIISPFQNRLTQDYERLQDANRTIGRNPLAYLAKK